ncbi:MAG TPA: deoxyribonuclease HsdR, partial [Streptomyces sp.]|nr:deoxyribonuclease HsdR [Streptomyces sp.]
MAAGGLRGTVERDEAEGPLLAHLKAMGWRHVHGPDLQEAANRAYRDVFLPGPMAAALRRVNRMPGVASAWMEESDALRIVDDMKRAARNVSAAALPSANEDATTRLLHGVLEKGPDELDVKVQFADWSTEALEGTREQVLDRNDFLVVDQLRFRNTAGKDEILDLVLFVNGIPVVVIECKSPDLREPLSDAIRDLRAYTGRPLEDDTREPGAVPRGIPEFFVPVQLLIAADGKDAALGTISSD